MACAAPIVASDTKPVREALKDEKTAYLVDFFDIERIALMTLKNINNPLIARQVGRNSRKLAKKYGVDNGIEGYTSLLQ